METERKADGLRRRIYLLAAALALLTGVLYTLRQLPPQLGTGVEQSILPNGLRVITRPVHSAPVVYVGAWYRAGLGTEPPGEDGISHLLEHLTFKGTRTYGPGQITRVLTANGATSNGL